MQLVHVAGKSWPATTSGAGAHGDTIVGHRLEGGYLEVHEPGQRCHLCTTVPTEIPIASSTTPPVAPEPIFRAVKADRTILKG